MTLLDAPAFDEARERRRRVMLYSAGGLLFVLFVGWWLVAGRPIDLPWNWNSYMRGRAAANSFLTAVEKDDLVTAYSIWQHDPQWRQHPTKYSSYSYDRFQDDWSSLSPENEYGAIHSHKIVVATMHGNVLLMAILINGRKSKALNLDYDPRMRTLNFSPPGIELYLGP
jgi:hypothetical protein